MAAHSGTATATWGALTVTATGSDVKVGVVECAWGALTVAIDTSPQSHDGTVSCAWGE